MAKKPVTRPEPAITYKGKVIGDAALWKDLLNVPAYVEEREVLESARLAMSEDGLTAEEASQLYLVDIAKLTKGA